MFCDQCSLLSALGGFLIQELGNGGGAALFADAFNHHGARHLALQKRDDIANLDFFGRFDAKRIDLDMSAVNLLSGERPGFEEAGRPKPFVNSSFVHVTKRGYYGLRLDNDRFNYCGIAQSTLGLTAKI